MAEYMSYEEYLEKVKEGIVTDQGNCPVTPLLVMLQGKQASEKLVKLGYTNIVEIGGINSWPGEIVAGDK